MRIMRSCIFQSQGVGGDTLYFFICYIFLTYLTNTYDEIGGSNMVFVKKCEDNSLDAYHVDVPEYDMLADIPKDTPKEKIDQMVNNAVKAMQRAIDYQIS